MLNWFDIVTLIFLLIAFVNGYRKGLVMMIVSLATVILAAVFGGQLAKIILPELQKLIDMSPELANVLSYVAAFLAIAVVLSIIGKFVQRIFETINLNFINRILGSVIAMATTMVLLSIFLNLVLMLDRNENIIKPNIKKESFFYERVVAVVPAVVPYLNRDVWEKCIPNKYREQIDKENNKINNQKQGLPIDSTYQKRFFDADSV